MNDQVMGMMRKNIVTLQAAVAKWQTFTPAQQQGIRDTTQRWVKDMIEVCDGSPEAQAEMKEFAREVMAVLPHG
jgi:hypothetical protein